jgi:hypothetical protein
VEAGQTVADLSNDAGLNRFNWDLTTNPATPWRFAPKWNQGNPGVSVPPGTYTLRLHAGGRVLQRTIVARPDPRLRYTQAQYVASYVLQARLLDAYSRVDEALNALSAVALEAPLRAALLKKSGDAALAQSVAASGEAATALIPTITSNPRNDQDDDFIKDVLRERIQSLFYTFTSFAPPTAEQQRESGDVLALEARRMAAYAEFARSIDALDAQLAAKHLPPLRHSTVEPDAPGQGGGGRKE